ncbi:S9 family peptidase [Opitutus terrae]|uniref:Peptidase S9 prolyl oligopeptidase active site domain protein n=1 Tax=Opitutus terrae (strain DSM 11246 / JCM 15787 / PB90-1) TaxID=452637 RepID=B1ZWH1_OPITP|nr:S9 family peptidase [Opitutus terrae]ACB73295.1 peptidase S9 prolyl oligopeptidase active site domain protein [Opitutus terrae PB90-1]
MRSPFGLVIGLCVLAGAALAIERLPIEHFAREPETSRARLSPDGKHLAFLREHNGRTKLHVLEIDADKIYRIDVGEAALASGARKDVDAAEWVGDRRLLVYTSVWDRFRYGIAAMNLDGSQVRAISGAEDETEYLHEGMRLYADEVIHRFEDKDHHVLMLDRHHNRPGRADRPDVIKMCASDGSYSVEVKNPGNVSRWGVDADGVVRLGILAEDDKSGAMYRDSEKAPWRTILPLEDRDGELWPVGFDPVNNAVLMAALTPEKRWTAYRLDPASGQLGEPLLSHPEYDILLPSRTPRFDGMSLSGPIYSRSKSALLGMKFVSDAPRVKWFDREFATYQAAIDKTLPNTVNLLVDVSRDGNRQLWCGFSDQDPGTYYLLDRSRKMFKALGPRMNWIKPAQMAPMLAIKYTARDGLVIHGFLTVPIGHAAKGLPLVVMPHGGPWVRDLWGFDPEIQLLANRGYAVLQMNYRGSPGYGEELFRKARREIGRKIQDDIEDATRWAIAAGVADPQRIAIYGSSYGGYSALFALGHSGGLYRCGISMAGVTDWLEIFDDRKSDPAAKAANRHWRREIGDPDEDRAFLASISPVNFADQIVAPVLIIQGKEDRTVPPEQARLMIKALEKAGRPPQSIFLAGQGHGLSTAKARLQMMTAVVEFLEKNLGPGVK